MQYGGEVFCACSSFMRRMIPGAAFERRDGEPVSLAAGVSATALLLSCLPTLTVRLSDAPAGRRLREHFADRRWGVRHSRLAQGVLALPDAHPRYLRGRSRQALRTNLRRALDAGISCRSLEHLGDRRLATIQLRDRIRDHLRWPDELFCLPGDRWWSARNPQGEAVALAQITVDSEWALLRSFVSNDRAARYLLHAEVVRDLIAADVRYLAVEAPMAPLLEPSLQYWQRLLGFRVANLSVRSRPIGERGPVSQSAPVSPPSAPLASPAPLASQPPLASQAPLASPVPLAPLASSLER